MVGKVVKKIYIQWPFHTKSDFF